ncbi:hypothetical protein INN71_17090 [Nocardioides sp. ChNu-153]|uniref:hypothetical protein n=1 Tax=Nocardioides sp. ChNu-153 TaxID=2779364 RepID=UPI00264C9876|nr:hypothetical protein [Nocardioides sp. ChNu-153]MDN7123099.1 hypothetical protein [Nocardioides sp. ChNu-153]
MTDRRARHRVGAAVLGGWVLGAVLVAPATAATAATAAPAGTTVAAEECAGDVEDRTREAQVVLRGVVRTAGVPGVPPKDPSGDASAAGEPVRDVVVVAQRVFRGGVEEGGAPLKVQVSGAASATTPEPRAGASYVMFLTPQDGAVESYVLTTDLCGLVPAGELTDAAVEEAVAGVDASPTLTSAGAGEPPAYLGAMLPGLLVVAIGLVGFAGTALLGRVVGRRH